MELETAPIIGVLDDLTPRTPVLPRILVRPFVFTLPERVTPNLNQEVAHAWWLPLDRFLAPGAYGPVDERPAGPVSIGPAYRLEEGILWGMTERILTPLLDLMR